MVLRTTGGKRDRLPHICSFEHIQCMFYHIFVNDKTGSVGVEGPFEKAFVKHFAGSQKKGGEERKFATDMQF